MNGGPGIAATALALGGVCPPRPIGQPYLTKALATDSPRARAPNCACLARNGLAGMFSCGRDAVDRITASTFQFDRNRRENVELVI